MTSTEHRVRPAACGVLRLHSINLYLLPLLLLLLLASHACGECLSNPNERKIKFESCPLHAVHFNDITLVKNVPSVAACGNLCTMDQDCKSFIVRQNATDSYHCQLSYYQVSNCTELDSDTGAKTYVATDDGLCSKPWRLAAKTQPGSVVKGSLADLRSAVLDGASVSVLWEPFPLSDDVLQYRGKLYVLDTVSVSGTGSLVTGYAYTYHMNMETEPVWAQVSLYTSGIAKLALSNSTVKVSNATITWMVRDVESACYQQTPLSHGGAVSVPAFSSASSGQQQGEVSDVISVLQAGSIMRVVTSLGTSGALAYRTPTITVDDTDSSLETLATWIPGNLGSVLPLRVHAFNFSSSYIEQYSQFHTYTKTFDSDFQTDPELSKTQVFLDPCWELKVSIDDSGQILSGSHKELGVAVRSGARILMVLNNGSAQTMLESEEIQLFHNDTAAIFAKMGVTSDNGIVWKEVRANTYDGVWSIGSLPVEGDGPRKFYTDGRNRPFQLTFGPFKSVRDEEWSEARLRMQSGQLPRAMLTLAGYDLRYLDVQHATLIHQSWNVVLMSYRQPWEDGFKVYYIGLNDYVRVDVGLYHFHGTNVEEEWTEYDHVTLFFEDFPQDS